MSEDRSYILLKKLSPPKPTGKSSYTSTEASPDPYIRDAATMNAERWILMTGLVPEAASSLLRFPNARIQFSNCSPELMLASDVCSTHSTPRGQPSNPYGTWPIRLLFVIFMIE